MKAIDISLLKLRRGAVALFTILLVELWTITPARAQAQKPRGEFVHIEWIVMRDGSGAKSGQALRMKIPSAFVYEMYYDKSGEAERFKGVKNNGIEIILLQAWLPNLTPRPEDLPAKSRIQDLPPDQRSKYVNRHLLVQLNAQAGMSPRSVVHESMQFGIKKKTVYRLPDVHGLERYRRMTCQQLEPQEASKPKLADEQAPPGCREIAGDETYLTPESENERIWISCSRGASGACALRFSYQRLWAVRSNFSAGELPRWRDWKQKTEELLNRFVVDR